MTSSRVVSLLGSLSDREAPRTEAMVQADVRELLLVAPLGLDDEDVVTLEAQVGGRRRIDVEGLGVVSAAELLAEVGDPARFHSEERLRSLVRSGAHGGVLRRGRRRTLPPPP